MPSRSPIIPTAAGNRLLFRALQEENDSTGEPGPSTFFLQSPLSRQKQDLKQSEKLNYSTFPRVPEDKTTAASPQFEVPEALLFQQGSSQESQEVMQSNTNENKNPSKLTIIEEEKSNWDVIENNSNKTKDTCNLESCYGIQPTDDEFIILTTEIKSKSATLIRDESRDVTDASVIDDASASQSGTNSSVNLPSSYKRTVTSQSEFSEDELFPLEAAAAGKAPEFGLNETKKLQREARRWMKAEKQAIARAKVDVSEARLDEFESKLRARQAHIQESHARLCHRRAVIKRAEERLQDLESRLDEIEEEHREREQEVRTKERRLKQEESRIASEEASLKKREENINEELKNVERRKKLVEGKEAMTSLMRSIIAEKERYHTSQVTSSKNSTQQYYFLKKEYSPKAYQPPPKTAPEFSITPRKKGKDSQNPWKRSSGYETEGVLRQAKDPEFQYESSNLGSLPRPKSKGTMGLWL